MQDCDIRCCDSAFVPIDMGKFDEWSKEVQASGELDSSKKVVELLRKCPFFQTQTQTQTQPTASSSVSSSSLPEVSLPSVSSPSVSSPTISTESPTESPTESESLHSTLAAMESKTMEKCTHKRGEHPVLNPLLTTDGILMILRKLIQGEVCLPIPQEGCPKKPEPSPCTFSSQDLRLLLSDSMDRKQLEEKLQGVTVPHLQELLKIWTRYEGNETVPSGEPLSRAVVRTWYTFLQKVNSKEISMVHYFDFCPLFLRDLLHCHLYSQACDFFTPNNVKVLQGNWRDFTWVLTSLAQHLDDEKDEKQLVVDMYKRALDGFDVSTSNLSLDDMDFVLAEISTRLEKTKKETSPTEPRTIVLTSLLEKTRSLVLVNKKVVL